MILVNGSHLVKTRPIPIRKLYKAPIIPVVFLRYNEFAKKIYLEILWLLWRWESI